MTTHAERPDVHKRRRWLMLLAVAAVMSLGLGLLAGYLLFRPDDSDAPSACRGVEAIDGDYEEVTADGVEGPGIHRLSAIGFYALAAGNDDKEYDALGEAGYDLVAANQRVDAEAADAALDDVRAACDDLGY